MNRFLTTDERRLIKKMPCEQVETDRYRLHDEDGPALVTHNRKKAYYIHGLTPDGYNPNMET